MKHLSISNPNDLLSLSNKVKLQYFFKAFMSTSMRKSRDASSNEVVPFETDDLGNMQVCSQVEDEFPELSKMISNYYTKKDKCIYIQIADKLF